VVGEIIGETSPLGAGCSGPSDWPSLGMGVSVLTGISPERFALPNAASLVARSSGLGVRSRPVPTPLCPLCPVTLIAEPDCDGSALEDAASVAEAMVSAAEIAVGQGVTISSNVGCTVGKTVWESCVSLAIVCGVNDKVGEFLAGDDVVAPPQAPRARLKTISAASFFLIFSSP
jgi:hypothetical protein